MRSKVVMWFERVLVDEETGYKRSGAVGHNTSRGGVSWRLRDSNSRLATPLEKCGHQAQPNTCRYCSHEMVFLVLSRNEVLGEDTNSTLALSVIFRVIKTFSNHFRGILQRHMLNMTGTVTYDLKFLSVSYDY